MDLLDRLMDLVVNSSEPAYVLDTWGNVVDDPEEVSRAVDLLTRSLARPSMTGSMRWTMMALGMTDQMLSATSELQSTLDDFNTTFGVEPPLRVEQFGFLIKGNSPSSEMDNTPPEYRKNRWSNYAMKVTHIDPLLMDLWSPDVEQGSQLLNRLTDLAPMVETWRKPVMTGLICINMPEEVTDGLAAIRMRSSGKPVDSESIREWNDSIRRLRRTLEGKIDQAYVLPKNQNPEKLSRCVEQRNLLVNVVNGWVQDYSSSLARSIDLESPSLARWNLIPNQGAIDIMNALTDMLNGDSAQLEAILRPVACRLLNGRVKTDIRFTNDGLTAELGDLVMRHMATSRSPIRIRWNVSPWSPLSVQGLPQLDIVDIFAPDLQSRHHDYLLSWMAFDKPFTAMQQLVESLVAASPKVDAEDDSWWCDNYGWKWDSYGPFGESPTMDILRRYRDLWEDYDRDAPVVPLAYDILNEQISIWQMNPYRP